MVLLLSYSVAPDSLKKNQVVSRSWNEMIWYRISELMLQISFLIQSKNKRLTKIFQAVRCHILWSYDHLVPYINLLNLS